MAFFFFLIGIFILFVLCSLRLAKESDEQMEEMDSKK